MKFNQKNLSKAWGIFGLASWDSSKQAMAVLIEIGFSLTVFQIKVFNIIKPIQNKETNYGELTSWGV